MVYHFGSDKGDGKWQCVTHSGGRACIHINTARKYMQRIDTESSGDENDDVVEEGVDKCTCLIGVRNIK